jgi:hypothetical protein
LVQGAVFKLSALDVQFLRFLENEEVERYKRDQRAVDHAPDFTLGSHNAECQEGK